MPSYIHHGTTRVGIRNNADQREWEESLDSREGSSGRMVVDYVEMRVRETVRRLLSPDSGTRQESGAFQS